MIGATRHCVVDIACENSLKPSSSTNIISPYSSSMRPAESGTYRPDDHRCKIISACQLSGHLAPKSFAPVAPAPASLPGPRQPYKRLEQWFRGRFTLDAAGRKQVRGRGAAVFERGSCGHESRATHMNSASSDKNISGFRFVFRTVLELFRSICGATCNTANKLESLL